MNFNKATIVGNLTRDPETRTLPSGNPVTSFGVATNRVWNNQEGEKQTETEFHNIVAFGKLADICSRYLNKGKLVLVEGRIKTQSWQDQNGVKKYRTEIIAENMQMGPRTDGSGSGPIGPANQGASSPASGPDNQPASEMNMPSQKEIPVIEADEPTSDEKDSPDSKKKGVDVNDIPF